LVGIVLSDFESQWQKEMIRRIDSQSRFKKKPDKICWFCFGVAFVGGVRGERGEVRGMGGGEKGIRGMGGRGAGCRGMEGEGVVRERGRGAEVKGRRSFGEERGEGGVRIGEGEREGRRWDF